MATTRKLIIARTPGTGDSNRAPDYGRQTVAVSSAGVIYCLLSTGPFLGSIYELEIHYSSDNGDTWNHEEVVTNDYYKQFCELAIDSNDNLHIIYQDSSKNLRYVKGIPGNWDAPVTIETFDYTSVYFSMSIDSNDAVHILASGRKTILGDASVVLRHYYYSDGWTYETIEEGLYGSPLSWYTPFIAIGDDDTLHICYAKQTSPYPLYYRQKPDGGSWSAVETAYAEFGLTVVWVTADSSGVVHIVSPNGMSGYGCRYKYRSVEGDWSDYEALNPEGGNVSGNFPAISIDGNGTLWVTDAGWRWYKTASGSWTLVTENSGRTVINYIDVSITPNPSQLSARHPAGALPDEEAYIVIAENDNTSDLFGHWLIIQTTIPDSSVYPTETTTRVSSLRHIYRPGSYRAVISFGSLVGGFGLPQRTYPEPVVTPPKPTPSPDPIPPYEPGPYWGTPTPVPTPSPAPIYIPSIPGIWLPRDTAEELFGGMTSQGTYGNWEEMNFLERARSLARATWEMATYPVRTFLHWITKKEEPSDYDKWHDPTAMM